MSKKKESSKSLQKRLSTIVEIYLEQKGKHKKKEMKQFIEQKMDEIIAFRELLNTKVKQGKKTEKVIEQSFASTIPILTGPTIEKQSEPQVSLTNQDND